MATKDLKAKLVIDAQTEGQDEVQALVAGLEDLAQQGGEAAPKFAELAQSLKTLAGQERLIDDFAQLKREAKAAGDAMDAATAQVDQMAAALEQSGQAAKLAAQAQASAARELEAARSHQTQLRDAIAQARAELRLSRDAVAQGGGGQRPIRRACARQRRAAQGVAGRGAQRGCECAVARGRAQGKRGG